MTMVLIFFLVIRIPPIRLMGFFIFASFFRGFWPTWWLRIRIIFFHFALFFNFFVVRIIFFWTFFCLFVPTLRIIVFYSFVFFGRLIFWATLILLLFWWSFFVRIFFLFFWRSIFIGIFSMWFLGFFMFFDHFSFFVRHFFITFDLLFFLITFFGFFRSFLFRILVRKSIRKKLK